MAGRLHHHELTAGHVTVDVLADRVRRDHVVGALQDQRRASRTEPRSCAVVREERHAGEVRGDLGIGAAEAVRQLLRPARDDRRCP